MIRIRHFVRPAARFATVTALIIVGAGCSYTRVDEKGVTHIVGFVDMTIKPDTQSKTIAGQVIEIESLGVSFYTLPDSSNFAIGYARNSVASLKNHALVIGNPLEPDPGKASGRNEQEGLK